MINSVLGDIIPNLIKFSPIGGQVKVDIIIKGKRIQMIVSHEGSCFPSRLLDSFEKEENIISTV